MSGDTRTSLFFIKKIDKLCLMPKKKLAVDEQIKDQETITNPSSGIRIQKFCTLFMFKTGDRRNPTAGLEQSG
jgi:hypothetical protein